MTFQRTNVNKALGSVSKMVVSGNRVVYDASGSYIENEMTKDMLWLRERDVVYVVEMMAALQGKEQKSKPLERVNRLWRGGTCSTAFQSK